MRPGMLAHEMVENPRHPFRVRLALCAVQTCDDGLSAFRESQRFLELRLSQMKDVQTLQHADLIMLGADRFGQR
jgi:hypothetical protein